MAETQLASMRFGSVAASLPETDIRRTKPHTELIHITDGQSDEIIDVVTARHIIENNHRKSLEDTLETFNFRALGDKPYVGHLEKRNRLIIPDEDGSLVEFIIHEAAKYRDTEGLKVAVYGVASYLDLKKARVIEPTSLEGYTASMAAGFALDETEWTPGNIESAGTRTFRIEDHTNPFALLKRIAREFELELNFRVEHDGNRITGRYVDLLERVGEWRGREIEFGRDLIGIRRTEKTENVVTALVGLGPEREDGTRLEVLVEDEDALQRWGRPHPRTGKLQHLIEVYEPQSEREEMTESELRQYTRTELNKRINAAVSYETTIADLEHVPGMENKQIRFGDTIKIKDTHFNPPLYVEARVFQIERSITDKSKKEIKLGDFTEYTEDEVLAVWRELRREVRRKISLAQLQEYAEPKKVVSDTPPIQNENVIWVDTSQEPYVPRVYNFGEWQKLSPTEAIEIGAETPQGAQSKANQAERSAKEYSEDASNLMRGIVDVGAVPLRTSATGARIEWDGANGLVQYDASGNPVTWLDLDGGARFSGELVAASGTFKGLVEGGELLTKEVNLNKVWIADGSLRTYQNNILSAELTNFQLRLFDPGTDDPMPDYGLSGYIATSWQESTRALSIVGNKDALLLSKPISSGKQLPLLQHHFSLNESYLAGGTDYDKTPAELVLRSDVGQTPFNDGPSLWLYRGEFDNVFGAGISVTVGDKSKAANQYSTFDVSVNHNGEEYLSFLVDRNYIYTPQRIEFSNDAAIRLQGDDYLRLYPPYGYQNTGTNVRISWDGEVRFVVEGTSKHIFRTDGTKVGGTIAIDGQDWGMSPIDSPQALIEYIIFNQDVNEKGTIVKLDEKFLKAVDGEYAVFVSLNNVEIEKKHSFFILRGPKQRTDVRVVGKRYDYADQFWVDIKREDSAKVQRMSVKENRKNNRVSKPPYGKMEPIVTGGVKY